MQVTEMLLGLGTGMVLSLGLGLLLARLLWGGLLRVMCVCMSRAQRTAVSPAMPAALVSGGRRIWNPNLGRASAR
ncbi:MAG TPA: hypothetical protein VEG08_08750 [Terriglobales bacterium]|nr:hypothetical protein [Terriglobales bacterium]